MLIVSVAAKPKHPFFENERTFEVVGCFRDSKQRRALPVLLANFRNKIDWQRRQDIVLYCAKVLSAEKTIARFPSPSQLEVQSQQNLQQMFGKLFNLHALKRCYYTSDFLKKLSLKKVLIWK